MKCISKIIHFVLYEDEITMLAGEEGLGLGCLMTPGLRKDIRYHVRPHFSKLANHQIRHTWSGLSAW